MKIELTYCFNYEKCRSTLSYLKFFILCKLIDLVYHSVTDFSPILIIFFEFTNFSSINQSVIQHGQGVNRQEDVKEIKPSGTPEESPKKRNRKQVFEHEESTENVKVGKLSKEFFVITSKLSGRDTSADESANSDRSEEARQTEDRKQIFK